MLRLRNVIVLCVIAMLRVEAASFVVNSAGDAGDGVCDGVECTLREAIQAANASAGLDTITFAIPGAGVHTIQPLAPLPGIGADVVIDASTQPGYAGSPLIELDGSLTPAAPPPANGLSIIGGGVTIRGFIINGFADYGISLSSGFGNSFIEGNYIGTDATGTLARPNGQSGIFLGDSNCAIGGPAPGAGNVISGNTSRGILIFGAGATENQILGNFIGTNSTGSAAVANGSNGVEIQSGAHDNHVGGTTASAANVISGNGADGVQINDAPANLIEGNFIGTTVALTPLANGRHGVFIAMASNNTVGGLSAASGNVIAYNHMDGVQVGRDPSVPGAGEGNAILTNAIFSNQGLGIHLTAFNNPGTGGNHSQAAPVLASASSDASSASVQGTLTSAPSTSFLLQFFANTACDPSAGEGERFIAGTTVTTDGGGVSNFSATLPVAVPVGQFITATATDPAQNTSEFSYCVEVLAPVVADIIIDVKPGSVPNSIGPRSRGRVPVAILTTSEFNAATVNRSSVRFGASGTEAQAVMSSLEDVDRDGDLDLVLHFETQATGIQCGHTSARLTGTTLGGLAIQGSDSIRTVGCQPL